MPTKKRDYLAIANQYANDVISGVIPAGKLVIEAAKRQVADLQKEDFPWVFEAKKAEKVCRFCELCPHIEGRKFAGKKLVLEPWQVFILVSIFGWIHRDTGLRRFKRVYIEVPKGNGKSFLVSAVANYLGFADGEPGSQIYSAATSMPQAKITFGVAQKMLRAMNEFSTKAGIEVEAHSIVQKRSNSFFRPLSSEAKGVEGTNPYAIFVDELHIAADRDLLDNAETACGKREGSLLWAITTAGSDRAGICYEWHQYLEKILNGSVVDDTFFGVIYSIDADEDDWQLPETWKKANPNWNVSVLPEEIAAKAQKAKQLASAQNTFKTKHLNVWVGAKSGWMDMARFMKCADALLSEEDFIGQPCVLGLDLASKLDLLAIQKVFWKQIDGKNHYYTFGTYWTNEARIEDSANSQYRGWAIDNLLRVCPGETNDFDVVEEFLKQTATQFELLEVSHDPWQAHDLMTRVSSNGFNVVQVPQMTKYLSDPMKEIEAAVYDGRFHFNGDPILVWAMGNVVSTPDKNDNLFPTKERQENKIDPATALFTAMNGVARYVSQEPTSAGASVIGPCQRCKALCIGKVDEKGKAVFICEACICA